MSEKQLDKDLEELGKYYRDHPATEEIIKFAQSFSYKNYQESMRNNPSQFRWEGVETLIDLPKPKGCIVERFKGKKKKLRTNKKVSR